MFYAIALGHTFIGWILKADSWAKDCTGTNVSVFKAQNAFWCNVISPFWTALCPDGPFHSIWHHRNVEQFWAGKAWNSRKTLLVCFLWHCPFDCNTEAAERKLEADACEDRRREQVKHSGDVGAVFFFFHSQIKTWLCVSDIKPCLCPSQAGLREEWRAEGCPVGPACSSWHWWEQGQGHF